MATAERSYRETYGYKYSGSIGTVGAVGAVGPVGALGTVPTKMQPPPGAAPGGGTVAVSHFSPMGFSSSFIINSLRALREPIVDYQEGRGVSRTEQVSFVALITSLCTHAYTAAITILVMLWNLAPLLDGFVYFARFMLDKLIDVFETQDKKEKVFKMAVFAGQIAVILFVIFLIVGLIFVPVYVLAAKIIGKIWGMVAW